MEGYNVGNLVITPIPVVEWTASQISAINVLVGWIDAGRFVEISYLIRVNSAIIGTPKDVSTASLSRDGTARRMWNTASKRWANVGMGKDKSRRNVMTGTVRKQVMVVVLNAQLNKGISALEASGRSRSASVLFRSD